MLLQTSRTVECYVGDLKYCQELCRRPHEVPIINESASEGDLLLLIVCSRHFHPSCRPGGLPRTMMYQCNDHCLLTLDKVLSVLGSYTIANNNVLKVQSHRAGQKGQH